MLGLLTALRQASLEFKYESLEDIVANVDQTNPLKQFVTDGGWSFAQKMLEEKLGPIIKTEGALPPPVREAYDALLSSVTGIHSIDVSLKDDITIGVDCSNFDIISLLPKTE